METLSFEYHGGEGWRGGWDVATEERLPRAVRVTVRLPGVDEEGLELQTVIALPVTARSQMEPPEAGGEAAGELGEPSDELEAERGGPTPGGPEADL